MKHKTVFCITDYQLLVYQIQKNTISLHKVFLHDEDGLNGLADYLQKNPPKNLHILVNSRQEEYRQDSVPHVRGGDRDALLAHKCRRLFPHTPYAYAWCQKTVRSSQNRSEDRVMYMALNAPELLESSLNHLLRHKVPISGISSLPLLSVKAVKKYLAATYTLLITHSPALSAYSDHGLRQTFFHHQDFVSSRLIPLQTLEGDGYASQVSSEIFKTQRYLQGQGWLPEDKKIRVLFITSPDLIKVLKQYLNSQGISLENYKFIERNKFVRGYGLKINVQAGHPLDFNTALIYALAQGNIPNHYAQVHERRYFTLKKIKQALIALSVAGGLALFGGGAGVLSQTLQVKEQELQLENKSRTLHAAYLNTQKRQRDVLGIDVDVIHIKNTVDVAEHVIQQKTDPQQALVLLGILLTNFPNLELKELLWKTATQAIDDGKNQARGLLRAQPKNKKPVRKIEILEFSGKIANFDGNEITALRTLQNFVHYARRQESVDSVKILEAPLNRSNNTGLKGVVGKSSQRKEADFKLELVLKHASG